MRIRGWILLLALTVAMPLSSSFAKLSSNRINHIITYQLEAGQNSARYSFLASQLGEEKLSQLFSKKSGDDLKAEINRRSEKEIKDLLAQTQDASRPGQTYWDTLNENVSKLHETLYTGIRARNPAAKADPIKDANASIQTTCAKNADLISSYRKGMDEGTSPELFYNEDYSISESEAQMSCQAYRKSSDRTDDSLQCCQAGFARGQKIVLEEAQKDAQGEFSLCGSETQIATRVGKEQSCGPCSKHLQTMPFAMACVSQGLEEGERQKSVCSVRNVGKTEIAGERYEKVGIINWNQAVTLHDSCFKKSLIHNASK